MSATDDRETVQETEDQGGAVGGRPEANRLSAVVEAWRIGDYERCRLQRIAHSESASLNVCRKDKNTTCRKRWM